MASPQRIRRSIAMAALWAAVAGGACGGGGGGEPSSTPPTTATAVSPTPSQVTGGSAAVGTFLACHKVRDGSLVLLLRFRNRDPSLIGGFQGPLDFKVSAVEPATWTTTGDPVTVELGYYDYIRRVILPPNEPSPPEITLSVVTSAAKDRGNILATNQVTIPVPGICSTS
jgi:hypothetical protein